MSVLREREYFQRGLHTTIQRKNTESGPEIETKISGLLSCSYFMINAENESEDRVTLECTAIIVL